MRRNLLQFTMALAVVAFAAFAAPAQETHLAGQFMGSFNKDAGFGAPNVGAKLSGALSLANRLVFTGQASGERAAKDFQDNGTNIGLRAGVRLYPCKFFYGEAGYDQAGQYNKSYITVGHSYYAGGGLNFGNRVILGADYVSNDGTLAQISKARVGADVFFPFKSHLDFKLSAEADFRQVNASLPRTQALDPRNFGGQGLTVGFGLSLK